MRRYTKALALVLAPILAITIAGCGSDDKNSDSGGKHTYTVVTAADPSRWLVYYALQHDLIESDTVKLDFKFLPFAAAGQASGTKQYDIAEISPITQVLQNDSGIKTKILADGLSDSGSARIFVKKDSSITSVDQLKGKRVGAQLLASSYMLITRYLMEKEFGLDAPLEGGDVKFSGIAAPADLFSALKSGSLDAVVTTLAPTYTAQKDPDLRELYDVYGAENGLSKYLPGATVSTVLNMYTGPDSVDPKDIPEIQRIFKEANEYYETNKDEIVAKVAKENNVPEDVVKFEAKYLSLAPSPVTDEQKTWLDGFLKIAEQLGTLKKAPDVNTLYAG